MKTRITLLAGLFVAQVAAAVYLHLDDQPFGASAPGGILMDIQGGSPDSLEIDDGKGGSVTVLKGDAGWTVPSYFDVPADSLKLNGLMTALSGFRPRHPAATSESAAKRFKVAASDYTTRVSLRRSGEIVGRLYAGDTSGYRRSYVRLEGETAVFDVGIPSADLSAEPVDWVDRNLYEFDRKDIEWIEVAGLMIKREGDVWLAQGLPEGQVTRQDAIPRLLSQLTTLRFSAIFGTEPKADYGLESAKAVFRVKLKDREPMEIRATPYLPEPDAWVMKSSHLPYYVKLPSYIGEPLELLTPEKFVMADGEATQ